MRGELAAKLLMRTAAALAVLWFGAALTPSPGFAQVASDLDYSDSGDCASGSGNVASGRCTVSIAPGSDGIFAASYASTAEGDQPGALSIPVELILGGRFEDVKSVDLRIVKDAPMANEDPTFSSAVVFPPPGALGTPSGARAAFVIHHTSGASANADLTVTILDDAVVDGGDAFAAHFGRPDSIAIRTDSNADLTVDNRGTLLSEWGSNIVMSSALGSTGDITIRNSGTLAGTVDGNGDFLHGRPAPGLGHTGMELHHAGSGDLFLENTEGASILGGRRGISLLYYGASGDLTIHTSGEILGGKETGSDASGADELGILINFQGFADEPCPPGYEEFCTVDPQFGDLRLLTPQNSETVVRIRVGEGGRVFGADEAILILGPRAEVENTCDALATENKEVLFRNCITVLGEVENGGDGADAAISIRGPVTGPGAGSTVLTIGPEGRVVAGPSGIAVDFNNNFGFIRYLVQNGMMGEIVGDVLRENADGEDTDVPEWVWIIMPDADIEDLLDAMDDDTLTPDMRGDILPVDHDDYMDREIGGETKFQDGMYNAIYNDVTKTFVRTIIRTMVQPYEALPSALLVANRPLSHDDRKHSARERGWWVWASAADGEWEADHSASDMKFDYDRYSIEAGFDLTADEDSALGLSAHYRNVDADLSSGGNIDVEGYGVGVYGTAAKDNFYVSAQALATWYEVGISGSGGIRLRDDVDGFGYSAEVEMGWPLEYGDVLVTPRIGTSYSTVDLDRFRARTDPDAEAMDVVSVSDAESVVGRVGVRIERDKVYASIDLDHDFADDEFRARVSDASMGMTSTMESEAKGDTWVRLNLGGTRDWNEGRYSISGRIGYAASSGDNEEFGASLMLRGSF